MNVNYKKEIKVFQIIVLVLLMIWYGLFFVQKVDLTTADLGRHLKNGELVLQGNFEVLKTNFYSYTEPNFQTVNHHWGSGVIFYFIWKLFGFTGLSFFYFIVSLIIFYLFFRIAQKESNFKITLLVSLLLIPLIADRREIRPEIFSYLFIALFFWILWHWRQGRLNDKWLFILPLLEVFWVNTHIYFVFGPALVGLFWIERLINKFKIQFLDHDPMFSKKFDLVLVLTGLATLLNPFGLKGLLYLFNIFKNYGYRIVENQSVWFLKNWGLKNPNLTLFEISFIVLVLSFIILLIKNRSKFSFRYFCLAVVFSAMAWLAIRNFVIFGFFALPIITYNIRNIGRNWTILNSLGVQFLTVVLGLVIFLISFFVYYEKLPLQKVRFGFGLMPGNNQSAQFFKDQNIQGPIFNNYDIGGFLIFHLFPKERVFVDNRPEAYPASFFKEEYVPMQEDEEVWKKLESFYKFNIIFFYRHDFTPWAQPFLIKRLDDPTWVPVFVDNFTIIFLKNISENQEIIKKYKIPKEYFRIISPK